MSDLARKAVNRREMVVQPEQVPIGLQGQQSVLRSSLEQLTYNLLPKVIQLSKLSVEVTQGPSISWFGHSLIVGRIANMVGAIRLERTTSGTRIPRATNCATPRRVTVCIRLAMSAQS